MAQIYKMHDAKPNGMIRIPIEEASTANREGYGIFWTVNSFRGPRRIENLISIDAWAIDMDTGSKTQMLERLKSGLVPTMVVETKRGFHAYWKAKEAEAKHWNSIVVDRLVPFYGADPKARDLARVLRVPGYFHVKEIADPFLVTKIWEKRVAYRESEIAYYYPDTGMEPRKAFIAQAKRNLGHTENLWEAVYRMSASQALLRLSGSPHVGGETFDFKQNSNGNLNILVNGAQSSCWIDANDRIGSLDKGGPTIFNWLNWYHKNTRRVTAIMREVFPELPWGS